MGPSLVLIEASWNFEENLSQIEFFMKSKKVYMRKEMTL